MAGLESSAQSHCVATANNTACYQGMRALSWAIPSALISFSSSKSRSKAGRLATARPTATAPARLIWLPLRSSSCTRIYHFA